MTAPHAAGHACGDRDRSPMSSRLDAIADCSIVEIIDDGVLVTDAAGRILYVNPSLCRMTGLRVEQLLGATPPYPFDARSDAVGERLNAIDEGLTRFHFPLRRPDGAVLEIDAAVAVTRDAQGSPQRYVCTFRDVTERRRAEEFERSQRRIAMAVAANQAPESIFALVAEEARRLLGVDAAGVTRFNADGTGVLVGERGAEAEGRELELSGEAAAARVARTRAPVRIDDYRRVEDPFAAVMLAAGMRSCVGVPVFFGSRLWGCVGVAAAAGKRIDPAAEQRLARFAELISTALANAHARDQLIARATSDPLTGLANRRAYRERLREEVERACRHRRPLALVLLDVDQFKRINDRHGHQAGDAVLQAVARALSEQTRTGELAARVGGDEFALVAPETDAVRGRALAERVRAAAAQAAAQAGFPATLSAGIADVRHARSADELIRLADSALYWAKEHGRDLAHSYTPAARRARDRARRATRAKRAP